MRPHPAQDPEFRRALALDEKDQLALLNSMAGIGPKPIARDSLFTPVPVVIKRTPRTLSWKPVKWPEMRTHSDRAEVAICIDHAWFDKNYKIKGAELVAVHEAVAQHAAHRGIVRLPFAPARTWTMRNMRQVLASMVQHLPDAPKDPSVTRVWLKTCDDGNCNNLNVSAPDSPYKVEVHLTKGTVPATFWWSYSGTLGDIDAKILQYENDHPEAVNPPAEQSAQRGTYNEGYAGLDDDLDFFEKAARRGLHGEEGLTPINKRGERFDGESLDELQETFKAIDRSLQNTVKAIDRSLRETAKVLEDVGKMLIEGGKQ